MRIPCAPLFLALVLSLPSLLPAETVAYWRFEGATSQPPTAGVAIAHTSGRSALPGTSELLVEDASGNGNTLFGWDGAEGSLRYAAAPAALDALASGQPNAFAVESGGARPRAFTWSRQSAPSGLDLDSFQPLAWTIEASIYLDPAGSDGWRTFLGRDGHGVAEADANLACLYFQKTAGGVLRLQFVDAAGNVWEATDSAPLLAGRWYHVAAVSDGEELRLYKWDTTADWTYQLVATTDLASSADPRLAADTMDASSAPRDTAGDPFNWTIGSGMFASGGSPTSGHADFWVGAIDEVRISDHARRPGELLFAPRIVPTPGLAPDEPHRGHLELAWDSQAGAHYRVESAPAPAADWSPRATGVAATPPRNQWTEKEPAGPARFYRVLPDRAPVVLELDPTTVLNHVDEAIYGHFLEHIYRSVNGGLWGELVWNRSFELWPAALGAWELEDDILVQTSGAAGVELTFGDPAWTDYEFTLQARKDSGAEGFLILLRDAGGGRYWLNLGGWGNTRHQFEKGAGNPVGPSVAGSIATGRWYDLRVRAEGSRLRAWLDGGLLLDWTDPDGALLTGGVGIGTWATQARFRQFEVRSLGGASLFSGLPTVNDAYVPTEWEPFGPATPSRHGDAANSHFATLLRKTGSGESGLRQTPIPLTPQRYEGSLWARGSGGGEIVVRLKEGDEVLAEAALGSPTDEWVAYPFTLTPSRAALDGTLEVAFAGDDDVLLDQVSLMGADALATGGFRPDLLEAAEDLRPPVIRWPGGCFASAYRWKDGIGPQDERGVHPVLQWEDRDVNSMGTDEFIQFCRAVGAEPILVLNVGVISPCAASDPTVPFPAPDAELLQDALDWIEYCNGDVTTEWGAVRAANGHPEPYNVRYWEIDNETWSMGSAWYVDKVNTYAPLLRAADPSIEIIACGGNLYDQTWNQDILDGCAENIDYLSVHSYFEPETWASTPPAYEAFLEGLAGRIAASANPAIEIYNSEWNVQSIDLRTGLFAGGLLNVFERQGDTFTMGGPALMYRDLRYTAWNNAFVNFDHTGSFRAPNFVVMKLWRDHYAPWRIALEGEMDGLNAVATQSEDGRTLHLKVINTRPTEVPVRLQLPAGHTIGAAGMYAVTAPSLLTANSLEAPDAVRPRECPVILEGDTASASLPPYSASVLTLELP